MASAVALASRESLALLSPLDAALLCLASLLHDSAMHLSEDGFEHLISGRWPPPRLAEKAWPVAWDEFLLEASKFDARQLVALFGDPTPVVARPQVSGLSVSRRDRLLAGEFLRRHHSRLAHEIALHGVPGPSSDRLLLGAPNEDLANLVGLVARSHGMPLRKALDTLDSDDRRSYRGSHPAFVMVLLRVADYLQLEADRAPAELLLIKRIAAAASVREWHAHHAIVDIRNTHADPEAIHVTLSPAVSADAYFILRQRLADIQREIDDCWAVLGEVYGRFGTLAVLGLRVRRIHSNVADPAFVSRLPFLPIQAQFAVGNPDLLTLLVGPLYNGDAIFAIRELVQNAVDACIEHADILGAHTHDSHRIVVTLRHQDGSRWLDVEDDGVGMTADVIVNHFLNAGSSFCRSRYWHERHRDADGHSRVHRSGRFGVGVLAAYLIGDHISVSTRAEGSSGIAFDARLTDERVELRRVERPRGTTVSVKVRTPAMWKLLLEDVQRWDWYRAEYPVVDRRIVEGRNAPQPIRSSAKVPYVGRPSSGPWRRLASDGGETVEWAFQQGPAIMCNGIVIGAAADDETSPLTQRIEPPIGPRVPRISIWDKEGRLPLNLQRTELSAHGLRDIWDRVCADVWLDYVIHLLAVIPTEVQYPLMHRAIHDLPLHSGVRHDRGGHVALTREGVTGLTPWHVNALHAPSALVVPHGLRPNDLLDWSDFGTPAIVVPVKVADLSWRSVAMDADGVGGFRAWCPVPVCGARVLYSRGSLGGAVWKVVTFGVVADGGADLVGMAKTAALSEHEWIAEIFFESDVAGATSLFEQAWISLLDSPVIPYDLNERLRICASGIDKSSDHLRALVAEGTITASVRQRLTR